MIRPALLSAFVVVAALLLAAPAQAHFSNAGAVDCGWVSYQQQTDWGVEVAARGVACKERAGSAGTSATDATA